MAKYEATTLEGADQFLQDLLKLGLSKFTNSDEKEIDQYVREHQSSDTWAYKKTTCRKQIALEIITTNIISWEDKKGYASDFTRQTNSSATTVN